MIEETVTTRHATTLEKHWPFTVIYSKLPLQVWYMQWQQFNQQTIVYLGVCVMFFWLAAEYKWKEDAAALAHPKH